MKKYKVSAVICAAGRGVRAGFSKNKLLTPLYGAPTLFHTLEKFNIPEIDEVIVTSSAADFEEISALCAPFKYTVVRGGQTRTDSVKAALGRVTGDIVLIHDGARPFVERHTILGCIDSVKKFGSGICAVKATDTAAFARYGEIYGYPEREELFRIQTPQGFMTADIKRAYALAGDRVFTDDSAVYAGFIAPPRLAEGSESNLKLTYKSDFPANIPPLAASAGQRIGFGTDVHAFGEGGHITLGGVKIPFNRGFIAHSDGDVVYHALMDALLSAAGLKDIGHFFPDSDAKFLGADSGKLLDKVIYMLEQSRFAPLNISVTIQAEKPKLAPHIETMVGNICAHCKIEKSRCAVAAGTCEKLGFIGAGLGISAYCAVLLKEI